MSDLSTWYAVHCKPLRELQAAIALESYLQLVVYLPELRRRFRGQVQRSPFFPGYLFVRANLQIVRFSSINTTPGVMRLVSFGGAPQPVPDAAIEAIRELVDDLNRLGVLPEHNFRPGDTVQLKDGPLQGLKATFAGPMKPSQRVRVLINFLGGCRKAEVDVHLLERVGPEPTTSRERRTRGQGRKIRQH
jgi:transcriptional antiterminator RfaH